MARRTDATGALTQYLSEIRRHPLLDRKQETLLARAIRAGDRDALDRLVAANLRFVVAIARQHARRGTPLEELVNEGNLGLIEAARRYDETRGVRFLSYAVWWIRQSVLAAVTRNGHIVKVPAGRIARARRVSRASGRLSQSLQRVPRPREVAAELGLAERQVLDVWGAQRADLSLDEPVSDSGEGSMLDFLEAADGSEPTRDLEREQLACTLWDSIRRLPDREADVLGRYFGLGDRQPETLAEIAASHGVSRERIRALKERGLTRLRVGINGRELAAFLGD